jgi:hypothetical protein
MLVVVLDELANHSLEVVLVNDEHSVEALAPNGADESLGEGVGPRG